MSKGEQMAAKLAGASAPANSQQPQRKDATAAIIGAVGTAVAAAISGYSTWRANRANVGLMHEQNQWNLDQWNRENSYNLPSSQIARLKAAGLNPSLIYGEGGIMNEAANSVPAADAPTMRPELTIDPLTASQVQLNEAQAQSIKDANERENAKQGSILEQLKKQNEQLDALTSNYHELLEGIKHDNVKKAVEAAIATETKDVAVQQIVDTGKLTHEQATYYVLSLMTDIGLKESEEALNRSRANLSNAEVRKIDNDINLSKEYLSLEKDYLFLANVESGMNVSRFLAEAPYLDKNAKNQADMFEANTRIRQKEQHIIETYGDAQSAMEILRILVGAGHDVVDSYTDLHPVSRKGKKVVKRINPTTTTTTWQ